MNLDVKWYAFCCLLVGFGLWLKQIRVFKVFVMNYLKPSITRLKLEIETNYQKKKKKSYNLHLHYIFFINHFFFFV